MTESMSEREHAPQRSEDTSVATPRESLSKRLEQWLKAVGAAAGLVYALGFLVVNVYLAKFGVREFQLFSAHFISAGLVTIVMLMSPFVAFVFIAFRGWSYFGQGWYDYDAWLSGLGKFARRFDPGAAPSRLHDPSRWQRSAMTIRYRLLRMVYFGMWAIVVIVVAAGTLLVAEISTRAVFAVLTLLGGLPGTILPPGSWEWNHPLNIISFWGTLSWFFYYFLVYRMSRRLVSQANARPEAETSPRADEASERGERAERSGYVEMIQGLFSLLVFGGAVISSFVQYSRELYPEIPQSVGGGRAIPVVLQFSNPQDAGPICLAPSPAQPGVTLPLGLLNEAPDSLLVLVRQQDAAETVVRIARSTIRAIHYLPLETGLAFLDTVAPGCEATPSQMNP